MSRMDEFLSHFRLQRGWTHALAIAVPDERFRWAPAPDAFTCGGLVVHLIQAEVFWRRLLVAGSQGTAHDPFRLSGSGVERLVAFRGSNLSTSTSDRFGSTFAQCLESWRPVQEQTERELQAIPEEAIGRVVEHPLTLVRLPLWEMCWLMVEHEAHHRGQLSAYMKMLRVAQPAIFA